MNNSTSAQNVTFNCSNATFSSVEKYTSSQSKNGASGGAVAVTNNSFTSSLDAQSVSTFVSTGGVSVISPFKGTDNRSTILTPKNVAGQFMYLANGKRISMQSINASNSKTSDIFIMPGKTSIGLGGDKFVQDAKK